MLTVKQWVGIGVLALTFGAGFHFGGLKAGAELSAYQAKMQRLTAQTATEARKAVNVVRALEQRHTEALAAIGEAYEKGKADAESKGADVVAGLRAGTVRLRQHWQGCEATSRAAAAASSARESDAVAQVRAEAAGRIVRVGAEADAQVRGLQDVIRQDRASVNQQ